MTTPSCSIKGMFCRFRLWSSSSASSSAGYHQLRVSPLMSEREEFRASFSSKKRRSLIPVVAGREQRGSQVFLVDPHILEHWLFQDLLQKTMKQWGEMEEDWEGDLDDLFCGKRKGPWSGARPICLDCDAILFEFFVWLVENDDPSLRDLNLNDLMEFYGAES